MENIYSVVEVEINRTFEEIYGKGVIVVGRGAQISQLSLVLLARLTGTTSEEKIADTIAMYGLDVFFLSICLTREKMMKAFMEIDLKKVSVDEAKEMIKCVAPGVDEKSAHDASRAFCTGKDSSCMSTSGLEKSQGV